MSRDRKTRLALFAFSLCVLLVVLCFIWVLNLKESQELQSAFRSYILILGGVAAGGLALFFALGRVYDHEGQLMTTHIMVMLLTLVAIIQIAFAFAAYTSKNMELTFSIFSEAGEMVDRLDMAGQEGYDGILDGSLGAAFSRLAVADSEGTISHCTDRSLLGQRAEGEDYTYSFRLYDGGRLLVLASKEYRRAVTTDQLANQLSMLIVSMLFSVEFAAFAIKRVERDGGAGAGKSGGAFGSIRQIAFLFYFASRLSSSFITVMAKNMASPFSGLDPNVAVGLPQTADTFFTCVSLLFVSRLLAKRGWRPPFLLGLTLVLLGTAASAFSGELITFILSRGLVGLGYGFCWMTLRSMALLGKDEAQRSWGFAMLNAGIYVGMICGSTVGSILSSSLGSETTLLISAGLMLICGLAVLGMENQAVETPERVRTETAEKGQAGELIRLGLFALLMIAPGCIAGSFTGYYLPLYYRNIGYSVLEVGRAQLVYGLVIVYAGPWLSARAAKRGLLRANLCYDLLLASGLMLLGLTGGLTMSFAAVLLLSLGDSFGFGAQNNYFLLQPLARRMGESRALSYLSLYKKLMEMAGPTLFALTLNGASVKGLLVMGLVFLLAAGVYMAVSAADGKKHSKGEIG